MEKSKYYILKAVCYSVHDKKVVKRYGNEGYPCNNLEEFRKKLKEELEARMIYIDSIDLTYEERD